MTALQEIEPSEAGAGSGYRIGTLTYTQAQLITLFFWLMWNDFSVMLIEQVAGLNGFLMKDHGASFTQIALLGSVGGIIFPWINPWVSTWSDRHRGRWGRRRPFLFVATPFFAVLLALTPFMPDLHHYLLRFPTLSGLEAHLPMPGDALFIGICGLASGLFNAVVLAIFSYLYWDVVPYSVMGRFQSLSKIATSLSGLLWSFFIFGLYDHHVKLVYAGTAIFCLVIYLISTWQIKEGEYPPPDVHKKGGMLAPARAYFVECFSRSYYIWIFFASFLFQLGNSGNWYQSNYLHYDLKLNMSTIGWMGGWAQTATLCFGIGAGFLVGSLTDWLKATRLIGPCYIVYGLMPLASYFFVYDLWTALVSGIMISLCSFVQGIVVGAFTVEVFPREKLGQFCSAQAVFYQCLLTVFNPTAAMLFDKLQNNRLGFLWTAFFYFLSAAAYLKVYSNWKLCHGRPPVPHAG